MDLVILFLSCAFISLDDALLLSVAERESHASAFYLRARDRPAGIDYQDADRALDAISRLSKEAGEVYVGLMGVPMRAAIEYNMRPPQLLKPCDNIQVATAMLADFRTRCQSESASDEVGCTLSAYGKATGLNDDNFAEEIIFGALTANDVDTRSTDAERVSERVLFDKESKKADADTLFFKLDLDTLSENSDTKVAEELDD